jgi:hypothetical protein
MMMRHADAQSRRDAPALRFLLACGGGWIAVRVLMTWSPTAMPVAAERVIGAPVPPPYVAVPAAVEVRVLARSILQEGPLQTSASMSARSRSAPRAVGVVPDAAAPTSPVFLVLPQAATGPAPLSVPPRPAPNIVRDAPYRRSGRALAGWSASGWLYLRNGSESASGGLASAGQLGGSQAGMRLVRGLGDTGRWRLFGRGAIAIERPRQREVAVGITFAPVRHWPVDVTVEQRLAVGSEGRMALVAMASGGVDDIALPAGFRLGAYGQAGVVGARRRDGFADGAMVVDRHLGGSEAGPLRLGAIVAGAVQPGVSRVDVGPRLTLRVPGIGKGGRIALDWRHRVAGNARPSSGPALTIAADF